MMEIRFIFYSILAAALVNSVYSARGTFGDFNTAVKYIFEVTTLSRSVDALEAGVFNSLGLHPMIAWAFLSRDGLRAYPFLALSFVGGMFGLLPYLLLFRVVEEPSAAAAPTTKHQVTRITRHRYYGVFILTAALFLCVNGARNGSLEAYRRGFDERAFVRVMTIDFACFSLAAIDWLLIDTNYDWFRSIVFGCIPVIGPAMYLALGLGEEEEEESAHAATRNTKKKKR